MHAQGVQQQFLFQQVANNGTEHHNLTYHLTS